MGVKSLWTLLTPVGRPVMLENVEGKSMAIDSSIWIYQFQATMRDKEGRALVNAHVLGFLRRISKLLFYGIKPVFVFDGGAPALKRNTLNDRKKKKTGAASSHVKLAEKLLAAQLRREALNHAQGAPAGKSAKGKAKARDVPLEDNTVYLEDIDGSAPKTPVKRKPPTPSSSAKKNKFHDHDPYRLPQVDMEEAVSKATRAAVPDPRLATEDELRTFIEEMRPEDFDINSAAFRELPTEIQYEIVGDLRLKSRQTSYARLQKMLQSAPTPLDFSKQQIKNLRQRNSLTQQLLMTTDSIGSAHIAIPVRIASERNKEYVLMKNEGEFGGWILGIKDIGTKEKPITIDHEEDAVNEEFDSDEDMEEIDVPTPAAPDADLREYQREMALSAISGRNSKRGKPLPARPINRKTKSNPLFEQDDDQDDTVDVVRFDTMDDESDDDMLAYAVQQSLDQPGSSRLQESPNEARQPSTSKHVPLSHQQPESLDDDFYVDASPPNRLQTALSIAGPRPHTTPSKSGTISSLFGKPTLLSPPKSGLANRDSFRQLAEHTTESRAAASTAISEASSGLTLAPSTFGAPTLLSSIATKELLPEALSDWDQDMEDVLPVSSILSPRTQSLPKAASPPASPNEPQLDIPGESNSLQQDGNLVPTEDPETPTEVTKDLSESESDEDMEEVPVDETPTATALNKPERPLARNSSSPTPPPPFQTEVSPEPIASPKPVADVSFAIQESIEETLFAWSRTPSPSGDMFASRPPSPPAAEGWDAAEEMDPHAEEGEFARFMSQVKGRNMDDVRKEIDDEIKHLNQQRKAALRDSEDITQQMISQIMTMLRLFGIPYITAPMEAEAQCAELVALNLVDGVITDDSDVFLFGAQRVYKNMFNQSKTVECFLLTDLSRELGLDRDTLIQLAYLLGSDYTEGLPGVGPVVAMELLKEFPGHNGLHKFKDWWMKVQSGKDREEDSQSKFRKSFKKKHKDLYLATDWPNSVVRDAYYHPTVDSSDEPFKWAMPDLDGLREFFHQELGWHKAKVDELLLPIIQKMNKRNQVAALNKQGNLNDFLDISAGTGTHAPRQRQAYASKRLQQVISDFRKRQKSTSPSTPRSGSRAPSQDEGSGSNSNESENDAEAPAKKRKKTGSSTRGNSKGKTRAAKGSTSAIPKPKRKSATASTRGRGRGGRAGKGKSRQVENNDDDEEVSDQEDFVPPQDVTMGEPAVERDLRPRPKPRPIFKGATGGQSSQSGAAEAADPVDDL